MFSKRELKALGLESEEELRAKAMEGFAREQALWDGIVAERIKNRRQRALGLVEEDSPSQNDSPAPPDDSMIVDCKTKKASGGTAENDTKKNERAMRFISHQDGSIAPITLARHSELEHSNRSCRAMTENNKGATSFDNSKTGAVDVKSINEKDIDDA